MNSKKEIVDALADSLALMNDSGRHWFQGDYMGYIDEEDEVEEVAYCSVGAIRKITAGSVYNKGELTDAVTTALARVLDPTAGEEDAEDRIVEWNDADGRTWVEIVEKFTEAKERVLRAS